MDWQDCFEIETVPGKVGGRPVIKRTRVEPEVILVDEEYGRTPEQTHASFPTVPVDTILKIRAFARKHPLQHLKVLLDENAPHDLRPFLAHHEVFSSVHGLCWPEERQACWM